jgi:hypothetical protein
VKPGSLPVKDVLRRSNESTQNILKDIVSSTSAVVFLGTPHRGSVKLAHRVSVPGIASVRLRLDSQYSLFRALGPDSPELELGRELFISLWRKYRFSVKTFEEGLPTKGTNELVIPRESSSLDVPEETPRQSRRSTA